MWVLRNLAGVHRANLHRLIKEGLTEQLKFKLRPESASQVHTPIKGISSAKGLKRG